MFSSENVFEMLLEKKEKYLGLVSEKDLWKYSENTWVFISENILVFTFQILWYLNVKINLEFIFKLFEYSSLKYFWKWTWISTSTKKENILNISGFEEKSKC